MHVMHSLVFAFDFFDSWGRLHGARISQSTEIPFNYKELQICRVGLMGYFYTGEWIAMEKEVDPKKYNFVGTNDHLVDYATTEGNGALNW